MWSNQKLAFIDDRQLNERGKFRNLRKRNILELAENVRNTVNASARADSTSIVRHSMIESRLSKDINRYWKFGQLRRELQQIIDEYPENFGGLVPDQPNAN